MDTVPYEPNEYLPNKQIQRDDISIDFFHQIKYFQQTLNTVCSEPKYQWPSWPIFFFSYNSMD